jgi:hypothetical protein
MLALYAAEVEAGADDAPISTLEGQAARLGEFSNKTGGEPVDEEVAMEVNRLLGLTEEDAPVANP